MVWMLLYGVAKAYNVNAISKIFYKTIFTSSTKLDIQQDQTNNSPEQSSKKYYYYYC